MLDYRVDSRMSGEIIIGHALWQILSITDITQTVGVYGASETGKQLWISS